MSVMSISSLRHVLTRRVRPKLRNMSSAEPRVEEACFGAGASDEDALYYPH